MLYQVASHNRSRNPGFGEVAGDVEARRDNRCLDRVEHVEARSKITESVPIFIGPQHPIVAFADSLLGQLVWSPNLKPPIATKLVVDFSHSSAEVDRFHDGFLDQRGPSRWFHHGGGHVARCDDCILRRGGNVHQIGFVESVSIEFLIRWLAYQDLRSLRDPSQ